MFLGKPFFQSPSRYLYKNFETPKGSESISNKTPEKSKYTPENVKERLKDIAQKEKGNKENRPPDPSLAYENQEEKNPLPSLAKNLKDAYNPDTDKTLTKKEFQNLCHTMGEQYAPGEKVVDLVPCDKNILVLVPHIPAGSPEYYVEVDISTGKTEKIYPDPDTKNPAYDFADGHFEEALELYEDAFLV